MDKYYKFVKASEELPTEDKDYICLINGKECFCTFIKEEDGFYTGDSYGNTIYPDNAEVEWLKEVEPLNVEEWLSDLDTCTKNLLKSINK